mgnify:CR=1 FL=1
MLKQRDAMMDNLKALLLFCVAFGHTLDVYKGAGGIELYLMKYIYLFHMPLFAFITGYFTKNLDKARENAVEKCLTPYLVFQGIYVIMANMMIKLGLAAFNSNVFNSSIIVPSSAFYYLLAVFFWKMFAKDIMKLRCPLIISILLGEVISLTQMDEFHIGYGAVFSLLPFFVMGVLCDSEFIKKTRNIPKVVAVIILMLGILPAVYLPYAIHSVRMNYSSVGFGNLEGMAYRLLYYVIAMLMGMALICLMSEKKNIFTNIGKSSILVYAGSTFLAPHGYVLLDKLLSLSSHRIVNLVGMIVYCVCVVLFCSTPVFLQWYNYVINMINKWIVKR